MNKYIGFLKKVLNMYMNMNSVFECLVGFFLDKNNIVYYIVSLRVFKLDENDKYYLLLVSYLFGNICGFFKICYF